MRQSAKKAVKVPGKAELYRRLPAVDELLRSQSFAGLIASHGKPEVAEATRAVLAKLRSQISAHRMDAAGLEDALAGIASAVDRELHADLEYSLRPVINATGVILHTNLGRAPLSPSSLEHILKTAGTYSNLELELASGERGRRDVHVDRLFRRLLRQQDSRPSFHHAAETSTIVVNNNAAALLLALDTLAAGGEVLVSRGELIEIGESFRLPDIFSKSSATLREVGSTNRTRLRDYEEAIGDQTRLLLRVHRSNFQITGFTEQPPIGGLVDLARRRNVPLMLDLGSGAMIGLGDEGIEDEPTVLDSLRAGIDMAAYSGDKLLGGPQSGILAGRSDLIARMRSNPLFRALRVDKLTYAALEATLLAYVKRDYDAIPALRMIRMSKQAISQRAEALAAALQDSGLEVELLDGESVIGGGASPAAALPTRLVAIASRQLAAEELSARLRGSEVPVLARIEQGRVLLDLRTVFPEQDAVLTQRLGKMTAHWKS
jgi:L-seryl-tRNA(Ser) seleniumtransferase